MKTKILLLLLLIMSSYSYSQEKDTVPFKRNELKINALLLIAGAFEVTYEHVLNEESGVGVAVFASFDKDIDTKFSLTPYYRFYFGKKPASGFFVEGFGMLNTYERDGYNKYDYNTGALVDAVPDKNITDFALGFGIGSKWVNKKGFLFEINLGVGRNLFNSSDEYKDDYDDYHNDENDYQIVGRGGFSIGYRF
ncbi:MAG TPA: DUF3575 domain-containing protein [Flavobacterium sp.]|nr:DUF3575 domain-containing protein [Flavobacterium sp.]